MTSSITTAGAFDGVTEYVTGSADSCAGAEKREDRANESVPEDRAELPNVALPLPRRLGGVRAVAAVIALPSRGGRPPLGIAREDYARIVGLDTADLDA